LKVLGVIKIKTSKLLIGALLMCLVISLTGCKDMPLLNPKGPIGAADLHLIVVSFILMLLVVIPVIIMALWFPFKFRASNTKADYNPKWSHSFKIELVVWVIPAVIVAILAVLTWRDTHRLDPFVPIKSEAKPLTIEAVSFNWKWVFIYPDQNIATVNKLVFPVNRPVRFDITSDTVVTAFFIPQLGSQIYAMGGKRSQLNLLADEAGTYFGQNMQYSGDGFPDMHFPVKVTTQKEYEAWLQQMKQSPDKLDLAQLNKIRKPGVGYPVTAFSWVEPELFNRILAETKMSSNTPGKYLHTSTASED
jgi:cytochrome o ubiquinol oxidase subunit 2